MELNRELAFVSVSKNVIENDELDLSALEIGIYTILCNFMNQKDCNCFPSYETIAKLAKCCRATVIKIINKFVSLGLLIKKPRFTEKGDRDSNQYTLIPELNRKKAKEIRQELKRVKERIEIEEKKTQENIEIEEENFAAINKVREFMSESLADKEIKTLLKTANGNINTIKEKYKIAKSQSCNNLVGFLIKAIKNDYQPNKSITKKNKFVNYTERKYDPKRLEEIERVKLARKMEEINKKEKAKEEKAIDEKPQKNNLRVYTQNEIHKLLAEYSLWASHNGRYGRETNLSNSNVSGLDIGFKNLKGINFSGSDLSGAFMVVSNYRGANFKGSNLKGADLEEGNFSGANFSGADLTGINYKKAKFTGADFTGAKMDKDFLEYIKKNE